MIHHEFLPTIDETTASDPPCPVHDPQADASFFRVSLHRVDPNALPRTVRAASASFDTWVMQMRIVRDEFTSDASNGSWLNPFIAREEHHSRKLRSKTPQAWRRDIDAIPDTKLRNMVACVVWWDYFAHRRLSNRWAHLDKFLDTPYVPIDKDTLARGLHAVGYAPWHAVRRISPSVNYHATGKNKRSYKARAIPQIY